MNTTKKIWISFFSIFVILSLCILGYIGKIYFDVKQTINTSYEEVERLSGEKKKLSMTNEKSPFSVLLLGTDSGDFGRTEQGRSDTLILATINPKKETTTFVSIPRDTYTEIIGYGTKDKINHAYAYGGVSMAMATVENLLSTHIDYYVQVNLKGMKELVDVVGGVEVNNPFTFNYDDTEFPIGKIKLDGEKALKYSRMRYDDPEGDYGRQKRQQQILVGILDKLKSVGMSFNYSNVLNVVGENMKTDISWELINKKFKDSYSALKNIKTDQLIGEGFTGNGTTGQEGISYQRVQEKELSRVRQLIAEQLE
ncbi:LCP family glycopolymer transferase [Enterococcus faecalis]|uniref:LCP family glycopolymer transferase n=1 Tax=Enterococcus faecalis TaxID=1351 RepID=UPI001E493CDD|nr:LCP family protein [Enterococcus faecalis]MCD5032959.1 LCP family protein [Enterococcus faecalis]